MSPFSLVVPAKDCKPAGSPTVVQATNRIASVGCRGQRSERPLFCAETREKDLSVAKEITAVNLVR